MDLITPENTRHGLLLEGRFRLLQVIADTDAGPIADALDQLTGEVVRVRAPAGPVDERLLGVLHPSLALPCWVAGRVVVYRDLGEGPITLGADARPALTRLQQAADQLLPLFEALHTHGLVHGTLGPDSVWIDPDGHLRVMDLGLRPAPTDDPRADVAALARWLVTWVEGAPPDDAETRPLLPPSLPPAVGRVLLHAMDPRPVFRPANAGALRRQLDDAIGLVTGDEAGASDEGPPSLADAADEPELMAAGGPPSALWVWAPVGACVLALGAAAAVSGAAALGLTAALLGL
jgi:hypothetical protein